MRPQAENTSTSVRDSVSLNTVIEENRAWTIKHKTLVSKSKLLMLMYLRQWESITYQLCCVTSDKCLYVGSLRKVDTLQILQIFFQRLSRLCVVQHPLDVVADARVHAGNALGAAEPGTEAHDPDYPPDWQWIWHRFPPSEPELNENKLTLNSKSD